MAANAARAAQAIRPHIPMIRFPTRGGAVADTRVTAAVPAMPAFPSQETDTVLPSYQKPVGTTPRGSGIDARDLPGRFRRLPIDQFEIDYIERGGPE